MLGPGAMSFVSGNILAFWFHRRLGFVEGVRQLGAAAAMATIPTVNIWLVGVFGWRGAYATLGLVVIGLLIPVAVFLFRNRPEDVGQHIDGLPEPRGRQHGHITTESSVPDFTLAETLRTGAFWIVAGGTAWFGLAQTAIFFSLVPLFADRSLTEADAASMMAAFACSLAVMHVVAGSLADYWSARQLLALGMAGLGVSMFCLYLMQDRMLGCLAGAMLGFSQGLYMGASHPLWARYFGRLHLGRIRGMLMTLCIAASSLGPFLAGAVRDHTGRFDGAILTFAVVPIPLAIICLCVAPPHAAAGLPIVARRP
jgi:MFS family permease